MASFKGFKSLSLMTAVLALAVGSNVAAAEPDLTVGSGTKLFSIQGAKLEESGSELSLSGRVVPRAVRHRKRRMPGTVEVTVVSTNGQESSETIVAIPQRSYVPVLSGKFQLKLDQEKDSIKEVRVKFVENRA